jgi:hypothetical protein
VKLRGRLVNGNFFQKICDKTSFQAVLFMNALKWRIYMKKIMIPVILATCLLFSGCGKQETEVVTAPSTTTETEAETTPSATTEPEAEATPEAETETTPSTTTETKAETTPSATQQSGKEYEVPPSAAANAEIDYYTAYQSVFEAYETIFSGGWKAEDYLKNDFPLQLIYCMGSTPYDNIGYTLVDLDNNGIQELLIGEASADPFYDCLLFQMYTLENGNVVKVLSSQESAYYQLCEDLTIARNDTDDNGVFHYAYSDGTLKEVTSNSPAQELGCTAFSFYEQYIK